MDAAVATDKPLLTVRGLRTHIEVPGGTLRILDGVDLDVRRGHTVCIVGESGCGKSMTARSIMRLVPPPLRMAGGEIRFNGTDLASFDPYGREMRAIRGRDIGMIFQEPMTALSPVHTIGNQMLEAIRLHERIGRAEARERCIDMLRRVGLPRPAERLDAYSFQLSGGMRQRAMIAMALLCGPSLLIADEPTTALDVTTQAQILDLMRALRAEYGMSILFITHDLGVVAQVADRIIVMYAGRIVEDGPTMEVLRRPRHPYTEGLLRAAPRLERENLIPIPGAVPALNALPPGCAFAPRCPYHVIECDAAVPELRPASENHSARCILVPCLQPTTTN